MDLLEVPPAPVQERVKVVGTETTPMDSLPEIAFVPDQPPEAVQEDALTDDQFRVELRVRVIDGGGVYAFKPSSPTHPSTPESKLMFHHQKLVPFNMAKVGPAVTVPTAPKACVPKTVPAGV